MHPFDGFASELDIQLDEGELAAIRALAGELRAMSWDIAVACVDTAIERNVLPSLAQLGTVQRLANLPAFIGGLGTALVRPRPGRRLGSNPILTRLARDHVIARETAGFSAREIVQEFLLLRRVLWRFIQTRVDSLDARAVLRIEDLLNSILDEVIAECTVVYFDRATHELSERSRKDSLTGMLNHQALHARLDAEIDRSRRYGHELQVIYFDLDNFKLVNDTHGHPGGDKVLRSIAEIVRDSIRETDFAGRMGGDEFVIGLVESNQLAAHLMLDRLRARLARRIADGRCPSTGISAGCAGFPAEADSAQDLLLLADKRLYDDKRARKAPRPVG
jgi:diguanylate cyclase (GGDEF)-like protein